MLKDGRGDPSGSQTPLPGPLPPLLLPLSWPGPCSCQVTSPGLVPGGEETQIQGGLYRPVKALRGPLSPGEVGGASTLSWFRLSSHAHVPANTFSSFPNPCVGPCKLQATSSLLLQRVCPDCSTERPGTACERQQHSLQHAVTLHVPSARLGVPRPPVPKCMAHGQWSDLPIHSTPAEPHAQASPASSLLGRHRGTQCAPTRAAGAGGLTEAPPSPADRGQLSWLASGARLWQSRRSGT